MSLIYAPCVLPALRFFTDWACLLRRLFSWIERGGYLLEEAQPNSNAQWRSLQNSEDVCLNLLWHRFGIAVLLRGFIKVNDDKAELFCINIDGQREQWCRFRTPDTQELPEVGARVELFGWEKWRTNVIEVLELREVGATEVVRE